MNRVKYPRTFHVPFSDGRSSDDKVLSTLEQFQGKEIVVTVKMDGESATMYNHCFHARSIDSAMHPSRTWLAQFWSTVRDSIPDGWRVCGENLYATHSIFYSDLESYFLGFSIWNDVNQCLGWDDTVEWFELIGIEPVPVLYRGLFDESMLRKLASTIDTDRMEGYVIRLAEPFQYARFNYSVAKWVRPSHAQTDSHWMHREVVPNQLRG